MSAKNTAYLVVDWQESWQSTQSTFKYVTMWEGVTTDCSLSPWFKTPCRYLKISLTTSKWVEAISGLVIVRYCNAPPIFLYLEGSASNPPSIRVKRPEKNMSYEQVSGVHIKITNKIMKIFLQVGNRWRSRSSYHLNTKNSEGYSSPS